MFKNLWRWFKRPKNPAGYVYYARLKTNCGLLYKLGYTKKPSLKERLAYGGQGDEKMIDQEFFFTYREDAWDVEQTLLEHFTRQRAFANTAKMLASRCAAAAAAAARQSCSPTTYWGWMRTSTSSPMRRLWQKSGSRTRMWEAAAYSYSSA